MKTYLVTTGSIFALIVLAHLARIVDEGAHLLTDPWWVLLTVAAAGLSTWAWVLVRRAARG
jgi:hypothetical protein